MLITPLHLDIVRSYHALHLLALPRSHWVIFGLHLFLLAAIGTQQGLLVDKEALKYTGCASAVLRGDLHDLGGNYLKYAAYVLFLVPFVAVGKVWPVVVAQVLLGILASEALGRLTERTTANMGLGRLAMALFLLCPLIQQWALALYTEHFFTCMSVLFVERLDRHRHFTATVITLGLITLFARPVGMFFVAPATFWIFRDRVPTALRPWLLPVGCGLLFAVAFFILPVKTAQLAPIATGQVIAGVDGTGSPGPFGTTLANAQLHLYADVGPWEWLRITGQRARSLFTLTRAYFSPLHNDLAAIWYLLYPLALLGLVRWHRRHLVAVACTTLCLNTLLIAFTHDEWSGRFLVPLLPCIILLAVCGVQKPTGQAKRA